MNVDVTMPQLGETVSEGTVIRWLHQVGDVIADQEPLLEIATDKVDTEVPSPGAGTLLEILVEEDTTVPVGAVLARLGAAVPVAVAAVTSEEPSPGTALGGATNDVMIDAAHAVPAAHAAHDAPATTPRHRHRHSPRVRRLAAEAGLDADALSGTGPAGRVSPADVARAAATSTDAGSDDRPVGESPPARTGQLSAATVTTAVEVDVTRIVAWPPRTEEGVYRQPSRKPSWTAVLAKAVLETLREQPQLNTMLGPESPTVDQYRAQHLAITLDADSGADPARTAAVISGAGDLNLEGLSRRMRELPTDTVGNSGKQTGLTGMLFTLADVGALGVLWQTPRLAPGHAATLGIGAVVERAVVTSDGDGGRGIAIRSMVQLTLAHDPQLVPGAAAARFLTTVKGRLEAGRFDGELI